LAGRCRLAIDHAGKTAARPRPIRGGTARRIGWHGSRRRTNARGADATAYIYVELLGNLELAASTLITGRHWREAAVLYCDRLHRPDEAVNCLQQGGLWNEAITLYEEHAEYEKAGDLYRQLDQPEQARQAYRSAVAKYLAQYD
jgi:hypothetical protein